MRAGFGIYYSPEISNSYTNMGLNAPFNQFVNVVASASAPIEYGNPAAVEPLFTGAGALGAFGVDPHLRDSRATHWNVTVEQALAANLLLNVAYGGTHGSRLTNRWDANRAINPSLPGTPIARPNAGFGAIHMPERATLIGGKVAVWSETGAGTEVELTIPAGAVYATPGARPWWSRVFASKMRADVERDDS